MQCDPNRICTVVSVPVQEFSAWTKRLNFPPFCKKEKSLPRVLHPSYFMPRRLSGRRLICCRLQQNSVSGFDSKATSCILAEGRDKSAEESVRASWSPAAFSFPAWRFLLCRRARSNDLPLLCGAPSAWPWASTICCLFVPVTSAPMGTGDYLFSLFQDPESEPVYVWLLLYVGVSSVKGNVEQIICIHSHLCYWAERQFVWVLDHFHTNLKGDYTDRC